VRGIRNHSDWFLILWMTVVTIAAIAIVRTVVSFVDDPKAQTFLSSERMRWR
jgi:hypothetical protein